MGLPTAAELSRDLLRMSHECLAEIAAAEADGDLKLARSFQSHLRKINGMIERTGRQPQD